MSGTPHDYIAKINKKGKEKRLGVGLLCTFFLCYMHPAKTISERYPNRVHSHKMEKLLLIRKEKKVVNRVERNIIVFQHDDFDNIKMHTVVSWKKVTAKGPP